MPEKKPMVLIDYSWVLHKSFHAYSRLSATINGVVTPTGTLYGFVVLMGQLKKHFPGSPYIFAVDSGRGGREKVYEWYKDGRNHDPSTKRHEPSIRQFLSYRNQAVIAEATGFEADDVIAAMVRCPSKDDVVIFSADNDMFQLVSDGPDRRVVILRSMTEPVWLTEQSCVETFGVKPSQVLLYRSVIGDESDSIPPALPRVRKELVRQLVSRYTLPDDILKETDWINDQHRQLATEEVLTAWRRNYDVMSFRPCKPFNVAIEGIEDHMLLDMAERFKMKTLLKFLPT